MMRKVFWVGVGLLLVAVNAEAAPRIGKYRSLPQRALVTVTVPEGGAKGTVVLAGKMDGKWGKFAATHQLALVSVAMDLSKAALQENKGCLDPNVHNLDELVAEAMNAMKLDRGPLFLFGTWWQASDLVQRLMMKNRERVKMWAGLRMGAFPLPAREIPYGLVMAYGFDGAQYNAAREFVAAQRRRGADVAWVSVPGYNPRDPKVNDLVRECFARVIEPGRKVVVDNIEKVEVGVANGVDAGETSILPGPELIAKWAALHQAERVVTTTVKTGLSEFPEMVLVLRLPRGGPPHPRILAYSYFYTDVGKVLKMARDNHFIWNQFAQERGLAVVTWNVQTLWETLKSFDQIGNRDIVRQNEMLDAVARAWDKGILQLARDYQVLDHGILLYGVSRGANFAVRLAARDPKRLAAVVAHVPNSFERPSPKISNVIWAISNGATDPGVGNAKRYYEQCRKLGLPVFLRFIPNLGHDENEESIQFAKGFFDYVLAQKAGENNLSFGLAKQLKTPAYVADLTNGLAFPVARIDEIPEGQRVALPDERMARLWGRIPDDVAKLSLLRSNQDKGVGNGIAPLPSSGEAPPNVNPIISAQDTNSPAHVVSGSFGTATLQYDEQNRVESIEYSNGTHVAYQYDNNGRLSVSTVTNKKDPAKK